eukprot:6198710-Pleurochrysis_carterae.AAC.1
MATPTPLLPFSGARHCVAIALNGGAWAWGDNRSGQLGVAGGGCLAPTLLPRALFGGAALRAVACAERCATRPPPTPPPYYPFPRITLLL